MPNNYSSTRRPDSQRSRSWHPEPFRSEPPRQRPEEHSIKTEIVRVEQKTFTLTLRVNSRGHFLRITEEGKGQRNSVIIPATGLEDFAKAFDRMLDGAKPTEDGKINFRELVSESQRPANPSAGIAS